MPLARDTALLILTYRRTDAHDHGCPSPGDGCIGRALPQNIGEGTLSVLRNATLNGGAT